MAFDLDGLVRDNVRRMVPYSSARGEFGGTARVYLDANENSFGSPAVGEYSRYPDPRQNELKRRFAEVTRVDPNQIFVGNGSDEAIDLLIRIFCRPGIDNIIVCPPTYGMYEVAAELNDVSIRRVPLTPDFQLNVDALRDIVDEKTKLIFVCSPNNPTGNVIDRESILGIARWFDGMVIIDEAYIHFAGVASLTCELRQFPNLVVLQTFSKAWGMAGVRVGLAIAQTAVIDLFDKVKPPYNVSQPAQNLVLKALKSEKRVGETVSQIVNERERLRSLMADLSIVRKVYPSDANFLLVKVTTAKAIYKFLIDNGIVVRDRSNVEQCEECLRITVGTPRENRILIETLLRYEKSVVY